MPIPDFQSLMLPLLELLADEQEYSMREILNTLTSKFNLSNSQKQKLLPSGRQTVFENRVGWARTYLKKAGLVESPKRAFVKITDRGLEALQQNPDMINTSFLCQYAEFVEFRNISNSTNVKLIEDESDDLEDVLEDESDDLEDVLER